MIIYRSQFLAQDSLACLINWLNKGNIFGVFAASCSNTEFLPTWRNVYVAASATPGRWCCHKPGKKSNVLLFFDVTKGWFSSIACFNTHFWQLSSKNKNHNKYQSRVSPTCQGNMTLFWRRQNGCTSLEPLASAPGREKWLNLDCILSSEGGDTFF